jgi:Putative MetA-pathway of phenol degradation
MALQRRDDHLDRAASLLVAAVLSMWQPHAAIADPQGSPATPDPTTQQSGADTGSDYNGEDFTRPESKFETRFEGRTSGTTTRTDRETLLLRLDGAIKLDADWKFGWLTQIPVVEKNTTAPDPADSSHDFGIGDAAFQSVLSRSINERWAYGFGARLVAPSAEDSLGSGKWQIMPGFGVRYSFLEDGSDTYFVPKIRYAISFAGDPSRRNISEPQIAPTLNIGLPSQWFVTLYPSYDIRLNFGDPVSGQTGRLFLPFDAALGRNLSDKVMMSLEVSVPIVKDYPVYNFKTELRLAVKF